jgi:hypothetical protein
MENQKYKHLALENMNYGNSIKILLIKKKCFVNAMNNDGSCYLVVKIVWGNLSMYNDMASHQYASVDGAINDF